MITNTVDLQTDTISAVNMLEALLGREDAVTVVMNLFVGLVKIGEVNIKETIKFLEEAEKGLTE